MCAASHKQARGDVGESKKIEASNLDASIGPSGETWTHGLLTPSQARYQLRHTRKCAARSQLSYNSILFLEMQPLK